MLEIHESREHDGCGFVGYWCRGDVDALEFTAARLHDWGECRWQLEPVRHSHYRCVPCGESGAVVLVECEPGRGAFAVTIADAAWPNREALRG